jgi:tRNA1Val (adenine37-N6)-methyltransferase|tara:strand:- start:15376 stop:16080 length:705 start_codon:yes stop_codon:yes gene_type:complete
MSEFQFKEFTIHQSRSALKVGTDAMMLGSLIHCHLKKNALDIGAGTGVLSMMVAQRNSEILITAIEIDSPSAEDATFNFENGPFSTRLTCRNEDFLTAQFEEQFELIFTNPPFYSNTLKTENSRLNQAKHVESLNPNSLCEKVKNMLSLNGDFWVIWPFQFQGEFISSALEQKLFLKRNITLEGSPANQVRSVLCFSNSDQTEIEEKTFVIRDENGQYTDEYRLLTHDYHNRKV